MEKHFEYGLGIHILFIDYQRAFDSVDRRKLYEAMGIPHKLVKMTMTDTKARAKVDNSFKYNKGVKQRYSF